MSNAIETSSSVPVPWGINPFTRKPRTYRTENNKRKGLGINPLILNPRLEADPEAPETCCVNARPTSLSSSPQSVPVPTLKTPLVTHPVTLKTGSSALRSQTQTAASPVKYAGTAFDTSIPPKPSWISSQVRYGARKREASTPLPQYQTSVVKYTGMVFATKISSKPPSSSMPDTSGTHKATPELSQEHSFPMRQLSPTPLQGGQAAALGRKVQVSRTSQGTLAPPHSAFYVPVEDLAGLSSIQKGYAKILGNIDNPFVRFLRRRYGLPPMDASGVFDLSSSTSSVQNTRPAQRNTQQPTFFQDDWENGIGYRYRPTRVADIDPTADQTITEVLSKAENWIVQLYSAFMNTKDVNNKPTSHDLKFIKSVELDKREVEATCRLVLTTVIHRCVIGLTASCRRTDTRQIEYRLNCHDRLLAVIAGLHRDKRICKDVLCEDAKIVTFVHQPRSYVKLKVIQETSNNRKASLLTANKPAGQHEAGLPVLLSVQSTPVPATSLRNFLRTTKAPTLTNSVPSPSTIVRQPSGIAPAAPSLWSRGRMDIPSPAIGTPTSIQQAKPLVVTTPAPTSTVPMVSSAQSCPTPAKPLSKKRTRKTLVQTIPASCELQPYCTPIVISPDWPIVAPKATVSKKRASAIPVPKESQKRKRSSNEGGSTSDSRITWPRKEVKGDVMPVSSMTKPAAASSTMSGDSAIFCEPSLDPDDLVSGPSKRRRRR